MVLLLRLIVVELDSYERVDDVVVVESDVDGVEVVVDVCRVVVVEMKDVDEVDDVVDVEVEEIGLVVEDVLEVVVFVVVEDMTVLYLIPLLLN